MVAGLEKPTCGRDPDRRPGGQRRLAGTARHRDGLPELRPLSAHDGRAQHRLRRCASAGCRGPRSQARVREVSDAARARRPAPPQAGAALRRPAPAGGDGPGARPPSAGVPARRAALQPGRQAANAASRRAQAAPPAGADDVDLRHPRPGRGDDAGRPDRRHERTAGIQQLGPPQEVYDRPGEPVRGRLHRQPADEPAAGGGPLGRARPPAVCACRARRGRRRGGPGRAARARCRRPATATAGPRSTSRSMSSSRWAAR